MLSEDLIQGIVFPDFAGMIVDKFIWYTNLKDYFSEDIFQTYGLE